MIVLGIDSAALSGYAAVSRPDGAGAETLLAHGTVAVWSAEDVAAAVAA